MTKSKLLAAVAALSLTAGALVPQAAQAASFSIADFLRGGPASVEGVEVAAAKRLDGNGADDNGVESRDSHDTGRESGDDHGSDRDSDHGNGGNHESSDHGGGSDHGGSDHDSGDHDSEGGSDD